MGYGQNLKLAPNYPPQYLQQKTIKMNRFLAILLLTTFFKANAQRNVILIIADDLGSDYCGFQENHLDTASMPNVRKLLARGVRFRNAWSNPVCSPTRAGMLTGRYSFRTGVGDALDGSGVGALDTAEISIPKLLNKFNPNGIAKANIGKWHLQEAMPVSNLLNPNKMGYDYFEGGFLGQIPSYTNWTKITNGVSSTVTTYATTEQTNNAISWIKAQQSKPFFLWLAYNAPHTPFHLPPANLHNYTTLSGTTADITANPKSYYKAAIQAMDKEIGRLFDSLQVLQKWDNTDIIFIGDNGDPGQVAQNTGGAKSTIYQEGVSVPFIISGPSVVNSNRVSSALVNTQDLFATILELFGYMTWQSQIPTIKPVDSKSILPILKNQATDVRPWAFTEVFSTPSVATNGKTMRNKQYKLLDFDNGTQKFYKIDTDSTEDTDLLLRPLNTDASTNYNYLCNEMTTLVGTGGFCTLTPTGDVDEKGLDVTIFPNPTNDILAIQAPTAESFNRTVSLISLNGKVLQTNILYHGSSICYLDIRTVCASVYLVKVSAGQSSKTMKVVVSN